MKKILIGLSIFILLILSLLIAAPYLFKDQIKATIDRQIAANINADVLFDIDNFSISLLPNFPNLTTSIKQLGVVGRGEFAGDVLFAIDEFAVEISLGKILFDDQMSIKSISLTNPQIFIKVLPDGTANYDIVISSGEAEDSTVSSETRDFSMAIEKWQISGGHIIYDDATVPTYLELESFNHSGSGNFSLSVFDLTTHTDVLLKKISYAGENYLSDRQLNADIILNMDVDKMRFSFKENAISLNDFSFGFDGWLALAGEDIDMDISFSSKDNSFKSLISLIPAIYTEDFSDLKSSGTVSFAGVAKGTYNESAIPAFTVNLAVSDGMFQYPDLPAAVSNVEVKMMVANQDGNIDNTKIDISKFHIDFGEEPFDAFIKIDNLINYPIDMGIKTTLNLNNLSKLFPTNGLEMAGIFKADIFANGIYDSVNAIIPKISASLSLSGGAIMARDLPAPLSEVYFVADINNSTGKLNNTRVSVSSFNMEVDGSPIKGAILLENFDNYHWQAELEGKIDFNKLFPVIDKLYPMPGTNMAGEITAIFKTAGTMSDVDAGYYERLTTSGLLQFNNFTYTDSISFPQGLKINSGEFAFNPTKMAVKTLNVEVGKSDFVFAGTVTNYIKYIFNEDETIIGNLALESNLVDLNEWMSEEEPTETAAGEAEPYSVIEVPDNINFIMQASIKQINYENLVMRNAHGKIIVKDGILYLDNLTTTTLGGSIAFNGRYDTQDMRKPYFDMGLNVDNVEINQAYAAFSSVQAMVPIAKNINGKASTNFNLRGLLQEDMMPNMKTLRGSGLFTVNNAELGNSKIVSGITDYLKGAALSSLVLQDIAMHVSVEDGKLLVKPFDLKINNYKANVGGTTGLDGTIDYNIKLDIPAGQLGSQVNAMLGSLTGSTNTSDVIKINLGLGGTYDDPKVKLLGTDSKDVVKSTALNQLIKIAGGDQATADSLKNTDVNALVEEQKMAAESALKQHEDSLKKMATQQLDSAKKKALEEAGKQLKNLFGPKKKKKNN